MSDFRLERHDTGAVTSEGEMAHFQIPTDRSVLSVLGMPENTHEFADGDRFEKDGWVYDGNGNKKRKWFITVECSEDGHRVRIWEPKLKDIAAIERLRWRLVERIRDVILPCWEPAWKRLLKAGGKGHLQAWTRGVGERVLMWREYTATETGVSWDWLEKGTSPEKILNQEMTEHYRFIEKRTSQYFQYLGKVNEVLFRAIRDRLGWPEHKDAGKRVRLVINGREYWMHATYKRGVIPTWESLSWPDITFDEETIEV